MKLGIIGCGRIGRVHIENIATFIKEVQIVKVTDPFMNDDSIAFCKSFGIENTSKDSDDIINDPEIDAVLIASSTDTHAEFIMKSARVGKHIFCEKPVDHDVKKVKEALAVVEECGVKFQIGFVRRFDRNHRGVQEAVKAGAIGDVQIVKVSSRDPQPPTIEYVKRSGGIFYDMMIHDFDMVRFLSGSNATEIYAQGSVLINPEIGAEGDVDTAMVTIKFENGALGFIDNSRQAVYGYDQRVEVFGSKGAAEDQNVIPNNVIISNEDGTKYGTCYKVMWDRYTEAFVNEIKSFAAAIENDTTPEVTTLDGLYPVLMAAAAVKSIAENRPVKISEVDV